MRKIFITGIGTDVGKTVVSAILIQALKADYWKPVQTGSFYGSDTDKIKKLVDTDHSTFHPEAYLLEKYMSPHAAAEEQGIEIKMDQIVLPQTNNTLIIEGAGGVLVPLNHKEFVVDLIKKFDCEVVLVIQNYLGSINHSLLTIESLKNRKINVAGIVFNGPPHKMSEDIIIEFSGLKMLGRINKEAQITKEVIQKYVDHFKNI